MVGAVPRARRYRRTDIGAEARGPGSPGRGSTRSWSEGTARARCSGPWRLDGPRGGADRESAIGTAQGGEGQGARRERRGPVREQPPRLGCRGPWSGVWRSAGRLDELAAPLGRPSSNVGVGAGEVAAASPAAGETEASSRPGTAAAESDVEPDAQPARRGDRCIVQGVDCPGRRRPRTRHVSRQTAPWLLGVEDLHGAREARCSSTSPTPISQLEQLDRQLLTRRDIERLFGAGTVRAAAVMEDLRGRETARRPGPPPGDGGP